MATITTSEGWNNESSHIIGYENKRSRYETYSFETPQKSGSNNIVEIVVTEGNTTKATSDCAHYGGKDIKDLIYFVISESNVKPNISSTGHGKVDLSGSTPKLKFHQSLTLKPGKTYYLIVYSTETLQYGARYFPSTTSQIEFSLTVSYIVYTNCKAPTSVTINKTLIAPGGKFTISWSGAQKGTQNEISQYGVSYKVGTGNWTTDELVSSGQSSKEFTLPSNATRDVYVQARVKTIGSQSGYDSGYKESPSQSYKTNLRPGKPQISITRNKGSDNYKIPHEGSRSITATAGTDQNSSQTLVVRYKKQGETSYTNYTGPITVSSSATYEFYTYDGLEYSDSVSATFVANTSKPTVSIVSYNQTSLSSVNTPTGQKYILRPNVSIQKGNNGQSSNNKYKFDLYIYDGTTYVFKKTLQNSTSTVFNPTDIRDFWQPTTSGGFYYKIGVTRNDGIEDSAIEYTYGLYVTKIPQVTLNQTDYFSDTLTFSMQQDAGYTAIKLTIQNSSGNDNLGSLEANLNSAYNCSINVANVRDLHRGSQFKLWFGPKSSSFSPSVSGSVSRTRVYLPSILNIGSSGLVNPNTVNDNGFYLTFSNFLNTMTPTSTTYNTYGIGSDTKLIIKRGSTTVQRPITYYSASTCHVYLTRQNIKDLINNGVNQNSSQKTTLTLNLSIQNKHGNTVSENYTNFQVCYVSNSTIPVISNDFNVDLYFNTTTNTTIKNNSPYFLVQGNIIKLTNISFSTLYHSIVQGEFQIIETKNDKNTVQHSLTVNYTNTTPTTSDIVIPAISAGIEEPAIRFRFKNSASQWSTYTTRNLLNNGTQEPIPIRKFINPTGYIVGAEWSDSANTTSTDNLYLNFSFSDIGHYERTENNNVRTKLTIVFPDNSEEVFYWDKGGGSEASINEAYKESITNTKYNVKGGIASQKITKYVSATKIRIKCVKTIYPLGITNDNGAKTLTWLSGEYLVYKSSPTISYRKNKVGINYFFPSGISSALEKPSLVVGAHEDSKYLYLSSADHISSFEIETGNMIGFIIDCGGW